LNICYLWEYKFGGLWSDGEPAYSHITKHNGASSDSHYAKKGERKEKKTWELVAHTCNPSYSGGRDQEGCGSRPIQANSSQDPISKNPIKKWLAEWVKW
jgi:hypothetical protein